MKLLMLLGGSIGFGIAFLAGWLKENSWSSFLWRSCLVAYLSAVLIRWWANTLLRNYRVAITQKQAALLKQEAAKEAANKVKS